MQGNVLLLLFLVSGLSGLCVTNPRRALLLATAITVVLIPVALVVGLTGEDWYSHIRPAWDAYISARKFAVALGILFWIPMVGFFFETQH